MLNYISAELYKVRRRKSVWILLALLLTGESIYLFSFLPYEYADLLAAFPTTFILGLFLALALSGLVCSDMARGGVLKNEISLGLPRSRIYLGKLWGALLVSLAVLAVILAFFLGVGWLFFRHSDPARELDMLYIIGCCLVAALPLWVGALGLAHMLFFLFPSPGVAEALYCVWIFFGDWALSLLTWNGRPILGGFGVLLQTLLLSWPFSELKGELLGELLAHNWLVGLGWLCATSAVGYFFFRRRELR